MTEMIYSNGAIPSDNVYDDDDQEELIRAEEQFAEDMQAGLSDDAPWKRIQQNTFTRWANEHLKVVNRQIVDLQYDLSDGLLLIALIEILSQKKLPKHNKKTTFKSQKLENVSVALDFLENTEQIKLVNIDASHIVDGRLKLILGLIWTLILHYYISLPRWEMNPTEQPKTGRDLTPKQKLMGWVKNMLPPDLPITNFTTDWNDGRAIGALVDACAPGLYPNWVENDPKQALKNTREAMDLANDWLGIPQLIRPEEMIDPNVDDRSMMTYLSQYPSSKVKPGAPLIPQTNASLACCYGKGIEPVGNYVDEPTEFCVETKQAGIGKLSVILINPRGQQEKCDIAFQNDPNRTFVCAYTPTSEGQYKAIVKYANQEVPGSPFSPFIDRHPANVGACRAYGPGLENEVDVDKPTWFEVDHSGAGPGILDGVCVDPSHRDTPILVKPINTGKSRGEYTPREEGPHSINLFYDGQPIPGSPFSVDAVPGTDLTNCRAFGPGVQPHGLKVGDDADYQIVTTGHGDGIVKTNVFGPDGFEIPCSAKRVSSQSYDCRYVPKQAGPHRVFVTYAGNHIQESPFDVMVSPIPKCNVHAHGPGLKRAIVQQPAEFVVETTGNPEDLSFSVEGPDKVKLACANNNDGTVNVSYLPTAPGEHAVHVLNNNEHIPGSPFLAWVDPQNPFEVSKDNIAQPLVSSRVRVYGPGVEPGVKVNTPTHFMVDCNDAGPGDLSVALTDPHGKDVELRIEPVDSAYSVGYTPDTAGPHTVTVLCGNKEIPQSPIKVNVEPASIDASKIFPEEYNPNPIINRPNIIKMNSLRAGPVDPNLVSAVVSPLSSKSEPIKTEIVPSNTGFGIKYDVPSPGPYAIIPNVHGIKLDPIHVNAIDPIYPEKVHVYGPGLSEAIVHKPAEFTVDMSNAGPGELRVAVEGPSKATLTREDNNDDSCCVTYVPTAPGPHLISVLFADKPVPGSPFRPIVSPETDIKHIKAYGPGIDPSIGVNTGCPAEFTVDARSISRNGAGVVNCTVISPRGSPVKGIVSNYRNGTYAVTYVPLLQGPLDVDVRYNGVPIPGSPFPVVSVDSESEPGRVQCYGPGLESAFTNEPAEFTIDTTEAGQGKLNVSINGPGDAPLIMKNKIDGHCVIEYVPNRSGLYEILITFNDIPIPHCPFNVSVQDRVNEGQVHINIPEGPLRVNIPFEFSIDGRQAGPGVPSVNVIDPLGASRLIPVRALGPESSFSASPSIGGGRYMADFTPSNSGVHQFNVNWSGCPVPGSPFNVQAITQFDVNQVSISGPGIRQNIPATLPTHFVVDTKSLAKAQLDVMIRNPDNVLLNKVIDDNQDGTYTIHYLPNDIGTHTVSVICGSQQIMNSPFYVTVVTSGDASKCRISGNGIQTNVPIGEQCIIHVDASDAGQGAVTATILNQSGISLDLNIIDSKVGTYDILYIPTNPGVYSIEIRFGGQVIPNGTFVVRAVSENIHTMNDLNQLKPIPSINHDQPLDFRVPVGGSISDVTADMRTPSFKIVTPLIEDKQHGTVSIKYHPTEVGEHELSVYYQGIPIKGSPYRFTVDRVVDGYVTAYGPGLNTGISGEACHFKIVTKDAGTGSLAVAVEGPSKAEIQCKDNKNGTCDATYWPTSPGDYVITVKYDGKHIAGSPFHAKIIGSSNVHSSYSSTGVNHIDIGDSNLVKVYGSGLEEGYVNVSNEFVVDSRNAGSGPLAIAIEGPSKANIECPNNDDGTCVVSYKVSEPGTYFVSVKFAELPVPGSPFTVNVHGPDEISHRRLDNRNIRSNRNVDASNECLYKSLIVGDTLTQSVQMQNLSSSASRIGSLCQLCLRLPSVSSTELNAFVTGPTGNIKSCDIIDVDHQCKSIRFTPNETGIHFVTVKKSGQHIAGSPYQFTVGPLTEGGANKVHVSGEGIHRGVANVASEFNVYTREAGAGCLAITVEGPMNAEINFQDVQDGNGVVSYICPGPGEYSVAVKFNDEHVPSSPFSVHVEPGVVDDKRITIEDIRMPSKHSHGVNIPLSFTLGSQYGIQSSTGLEAYVVSPSSKREHCEIYPSKEGDKDCYKICFVPNEHGIHKVHVKCAGNELPDSPFEFMVSSGNKSDVAKVVVSGRGLQSGLVGNRCEFFVDTSQAGTGLLAVVVDGPSKVQLDCKEKTGGYNVSFIASAAGDYTISIKFAGKTIFGSPYKCRISDTHDSLVKPLSNTSIDSNIIGRSIRSDNESLMNRSGVYSSASSVKHQSTSYTSRSKQGSNIAVGSPGWAFGESGMINNGEFRSEPQKVRTYGKGIVKAKRDEQTEFTVDATEAGHNMLMVGILGPTRPCEEVLVKHVGKNVYTVSYIVREKGSYVLIVKWGEYHIPGSPFYIEVP